MIGFALLTLGFIFIGQAMSEIEMCILGLVEAWDALSSDAVSSTVTGTERLNNPILPPPVGDVLYR